MILFKLVHSQKKHACTGGVCIGLPPVAVAMFRRGGRPGGCLLRFDRFLVASIAESKGGGRISHTRPDDDQSHLAHASTGSPAVAVLLRLKNRLVCEVW